MSDFYLNSFPPPLNFEGGEWRKFTYLDSGSPAGPPYRPKVAWVRKGSPGEKVVMPWEGQSCV